MSYIIVDIEADGPVPGIFSMVSFAAIIVEPSLTKTFYREIKPISDKFKPDALKACNFTREQTLNFGEPLQAMIDFEKWIKENSHGSPVFLSDNNGFDWSFINYYFHLFLERNPFGHTSRRIGDIYCGIKKDMYANREWKRLRKTRHSHLALDDVKGNAEAFLEILKMMK